MRPKLSKYRVKTNGPTGKCVAPSDTESQESENWLKIIHIISQILSKKIRPKFLKNYIRTIQANFQYEIIKRL